MLKLTIRRYEPSDCRDLTQLFYETVHTINAKDYTKEQLDAWADGNTDLEKWENSLSEHDTVIAELDGLIVGFGDMDRTGYLDRLYVHKDYQNKGAASAICDELEKKVGAARITVHASITAKSFFISRGYKIIKEQQVQRKGVYLTNYIMEKDLVINDSLEDSIKERSFSERFEFRSIGQDEALQAADIEEICFPPNEACTRERMQARVAKMPEMFLVAADKQTGKIAGFLNGIATDEESFRDEFFTNVELHDSEGRNIMILGLDVLPEYRGQGLAGELVRQYLCRERMNHRHMILLTCLPSKVGMYQKMGFCDKGIADSSWGGEQWHEMYCIC